MSGAAYRGCGSALLWQNLFWFFGHPEVYILALPYFGIVTEIYPVFSRRPVFGYKGMIFATMTIAALSTGVWAHHMFTTGAVLLPFFSLLSLLIAVPTGIKFFNWIGTMWHGQIEYTTAMMFAIGFLFVFLVGGVTGVMLASPPIDFATHDTYFVVAHFHNVLVGTAVFAGFAGIYYWYPKMFGRMLHEKLGKWHFWLLFVGFWITFMPQYVVGLKGMPRRVASYPVESRLAKLERRVHRWGLHYRLLILSSCWPTSLCRGVSRFRWQQPLGCAHARMVHHLAAASPPIRSERPTWDFNHPDTRTVPHGRAARTSVRVR